jgi:hypothetical protein
MGLPVTPSAAPAYVRTMQAAHQQLRCASEAQWIEVLGGADRGFSGRASEPQKGRTFAERGYGDECLTDAWITSSTASRSHV